MFIKCLKLSSNFLSNIVYPTLAVAAIKLDREWPFAGVTLIELADAEQLSSTRDGSVQASRLPGLQEDKKTKKKKDKNYDDKKTKKRYRIQKLQQEMGEMKSIVHKEKDLCKPLF